MTASSLLYDNMSRASRACDAIDIRAKLVRLHDSGGSVRPRRDTNAVQYSLSYIGAD
jgi:hypothetical protein